MQICVIKRLFRHNFFAFSLDGTMNLVKLLCIHSSALFYLFIKKFPFDFSNYPFSETQMHVHDQINHAEKGATDQ
jgi:hypothetical protein